MNEDEWNTLVDEALEQFIRIPNVIQNPLHQPVTSRGTPSSWLEDNLSL